MNRQANDGPNDLRHPVEHDADQPVEKRAQILARVGNGLLVHLRPREDADPECRQEYQRKGFSYVEKRVSFHQQPLSPEARLEELPLSRALPSTLSSRHLATEIASVARRGERRKVFLSPALSTSLFLSSDLSPTFPLATGIPALPSEGTKTLARLRT